MATAVALAPTFPSPGKTESLSRIVQRRAGPTVSDRLAQNGRSHSSSPLFPPHPFSLAAAVVRSPNTPTTTVIAAAPMSKRVSLPPPVSYVPPTPPSPSKGGKTGWHDSWKGKMGRVCRLLTPFTGIAMALCQCLCVAFSSLLISSVRSVTPLQITTVRMLMQLLLSLPALVFASDPVIPCRDNVARRLLVPLYVRCVAGTVGVTCLTFSMVYAPIADASTISYTSPIYVALLARIFLKEAIALADAALLALALTGVVFVTRPPFLFPGARLGAGATASAAAILYPHRVLGLCFAVASSILTAIAMVTIRKINKLPFSTVLVNFSIVGTLGTAVLCAILHHFDLPNCSDSERASIIGAAVLGTAGQFFLFCALRLENAGVVAAINSVTIVFTILLQIWFVRKIPPWTSWLGSAIIIIAIVCFGYRKWLKEKEKDRIRGYPRKRTLSLSIPRIPSAALMASAAATAQNLPAGAGGGRSSVVTVHGNLTGPATDNLTRKRRLSYHGSLGGSRMGGPELFGVTADSFMIFEVENEQEEEEEEGDAADDGGGSENGRIYDSQHIDSIETDPLTDRVGGHGPESPDEQQLTTNTLIVPSY